MKYISTNIKVLRQEARLSYEELSEITGISVENLKLFEKGKLVPNEFEIRALCSPLRIHYEDIIERDILSERNDAGKRMKRSSERNNYNWYLGNKKVFGLYLGYFLGIIVLLVVVTLLSKVTNLTILPLFDENGNWLCATFFTSFLTGYVITSYVSGICFVIWLLIKHNYKFKMWHLFLFSIIGSVVSILGIVCIVGAIVMIPSLGYSFYRIVKGGKK